MSQPIDPSPFSQRVAAAGPPGRRDIDWPDLTDAGILTIELIDDEPRIRDAEADWADLLHHDPPSSRHWRIVAAAIRNTDSVLAAQHPPTARGMRRWYELACDSYQFFASLDPQPQQPDSTTEGCHSDPDATLTWLSAPSPGPTPATVADRLGIATQFAYPARADRHALQRLLAAAQDAGVFGIPHRRLLTSPAGPGGLWLVEHPILSRHTDNPEPGRPRRVQLDLGPGRPLTRVDVRDLVSGPAVGLHAAVTALDRAAQIVNAALAAGQPHTGPQPAQPARSGRPFLTPPGAWPRGSASPSPQPPPPPPHPGQSRHR